MHDLDHWLIVDIETTGLTNPIYPVEIAAQKMHGWAAEEELFRVLVSFGVRVEPHAEAKHGYSREYLREHGRRPEDALALFLDYAGIRPVVTYNMAYDWDRVFLPTLERMGIPCTIVPGFCAQRLACSVVPDLRNHRLVTVIRSFGIADAQCHRAGDDVALLTRLLSGHIGPHLHTHGVSGFSQVADCAAGGIHVPPLAPATPMEDAQAADYGAALAVGELIGICRMIVLDKEITEDELNFLAAWLEQCPYAATPPISTIFGILREIVADGKVTPQEMHLLRDALDQLVATPLRAYSRVTSPGTSGRPPEVRHGQVPAGDPGAVRVVFSVRGSTPDPYTVTITKSGDNITARCTCPAFRNGLHCKHRVRILAGSAEGIVSGNQDQVEVVRSWLPGSDVEKALAELTEAERSHATTKGEEVKRALGLAKVRLASALKD